MTRVLSKNWRDKLLDSLPYKQEDVVFVGLPPERKPTYSDDDDDDNDDDHDDKKEHERDDEKEREHDEDEDDD